MDKLLIQHPPSNYSSYKEFIRDLIQDAISRHGLTFDNLNYDLYRLNVQIYQELTKEVFNTAQGGNRVLTGYVHTSR